MKKSITWTPTGSSTRGWIYYAVAMTARLQLVKIGFSQHPRRRMLEVRRSGSISPANQMPIIIGIEPGSLGLEKDRHAEFRPWHVQGEWFVYAGALQVFIAELDDSRLDEVLDGHAKIINPDEKPPRRSC